MRACRCGYKPGAGDGTWCTWCEAPMDPPPWWETLGIWLTLVGACLLFWAAVVRWVLP